MAGLRPVRMLEDALQPSLGLACGAVMFLARYMLSVHAVKKHINIMSDHVCLYLDVHFLVFVSVAA